MVSHLSKEAKLYPMVEKWMKKHFQCFQTAKNTGLKHGRIDVVGVRDVGGSLSGEIETISVEVKRGTEAFATSSGQALGYKIYANRVYLADMRSDAFTQEEMKIANHLGIGLIQIKNGKCHEIITSPFHVPMVSHNMSILAKLALGKCQMCNSFFETGSNKEKNKLPWNNLTRDSVDKARANEKGFVFWNFEVGDRKAKMGIEGASLGGDRRFICPGCIFHFFADDR